MTHSVLFQVKELGVFIQDCPCLAEDLENIFSVYWTMGEPNAQLPKPWPISYSAHYNAANPQMVNLNSMPTAVYFSVRQNFLHWEQCTSIQAPKFQIF